MKSDFLCFLDNLAQKEQTVFDNVDILVNRVKSVFLCSLWSWPNLYIIDRTRSQMIFWLGWAINEVLWDLLRLGRFFCFLSHLFSLGSPLVYLMYILSSP